MKEAIKNLLVMLIALIRIPADEEEAIAAQKQKIEDHKALINTAHGHCELNDPGVIELIDDLTEVAATATPDPEYAEVPEAKEEEEESVNEEEDEETKEEEEEETTTEKATEEAEEPKHETALQKKRRLAKEKEAAPKKKLRKD